jgi:hypothetical protein
MARHLVVSSDDSQLVNDGTDVETVAIAIVDGLEVARGTDPSEATILAVDDDAKLSIDGSEQTVSVTDGMGSIDIQTTKPAGSTITVEALALASHPAESDSVEIEVID